MIDFTWVHALLIAGIVLSSAWTYLQYWLNERKRPGIDRKKLPEFKPGDVFSTEGKDGIAGLVSSLIFFKDAHKNSPTHNMIAFNKAVIASAEARKFCLLPLLERIEKCRRVVVFRFKDLTREQITRVQNEIRIFVNKSYNKSYYFLTMLRNFRFFLPLLIPICLFLPLIVTKVITGTLFFAYFILAPVLRRIEKGKTHCSQSLRAILGAAQMVKNPFPSRTYSPGNNLDTLINMGNVECIFDNFGEYGPDNAG